MDDHPYYLHQRPNTFSVVPVSTLSAPIDGSNIVRSQLPTVADLTGEPRIQFPTLVFAYLKNTRGQHRSTTLLFTELLRALDIVSLNVCVCVCVCVCVYNVDNRRH